MDALLAIADEHAQRNEECRRRQTKRRIQRSLRDRSDPFTLPNVSFIRLFRFPKAAALDLIAELQVVMQQPVRSTGISIVLRVLSALLFYGQGSYQLSVGNNYSLGMSQPSTSRALREVTDALNRHLMKHYIKFPVNDQQINRIKQRFADKFGFPGVVGVIDGTLVTITTPPIHDAVLPAHLFIDRKGHHSLNVQIICDADLHILSVNARFPGSVHDAAIWMISPPRGHMKEMYNRQKRSLWLIGDSGYPNEPWLLTPVLNAQPGSPEDRYSTSLRSVRNSVERCIGVLKGRFRCLLKDRVLHYPPPVAAQIVNACAVLHNFLAARNIQWDEPSEELEINEQDAVTATAVILLLGICNLRWLRRCPHPRSSLQQHRRESSPSLLRRNIPVAYVTEASDAEELVEDLEEGKCNEPNEISEAKSDDEQMVTSSLTASMMTGRRTSSQSTCSSATPLGCSTRLAKRKHNKCLSCS